MLKRKKSRAERALQVTVVMTELLLFVTTVKKRLYVSKVSPTILVLHAVSQPVHPTEGTDVQETLIRKYHLFLPGYDWHRSTAHCSINSLGSLLQCTVEICFFREPRINKGQLQGLLLVPLGSPYAT